MKLTLETSPIERALVRVGSERSALTAAYRLWPEVDRDLVRWIVRWLRADEPTPPAGVGSPQQQGSAA